MEQTPSMQETEENRWSSFCVFQGLHGLSAAWPLLCESPPTWIQAGLQTTVSLPHHLHCMAGSCMFMMSLLTTLLAVFPRLLMQLLSADLLDCPGKGVGAPATDGWNIDKKI